MLNATMCYNCTKAKVCKFKDIITANEKVIEKIEKEFYDFRAKEKLTPLEIDITCVEKTVNSYTFSTQTITYPSARENVNFGHASSNDSENSSNLEGWIKEYEK